MSKYLAIRGATFYFKMRIPCDLRAAGVYGNSEFIKHSLETTDRRTAERLKASRLVEVQEEFAAHRLRLKAPVPANEPMETTIERFSHLPERELRRLREIASKLNVRANEELSPRETKRWKEEVNRLLLLERPLSVLTSEERRDWITRWFIRHERDATSVRLACGRLEGGGDEVADLELAVLTGQAQGYPKVEWEFDLERELNATGIWLDDACRRDVLPEMLMTFKRARIEVEQRTMAARKGDPAFQADTLFAGITFSTPEPSPARSKASKTVRELRVHFIAHKGRVKPATMKSYRAHFDALEAFLGPELPVESVDYEKAKGFAAFLSRIPAHAVKRYKGMSLPDAIEKADRDANPERLAPKSQADYFGDAVALFAHALDIGWISSNPFAAKALKNLLPEIPAKAENGLTVEDLNHLFAHPFFLAERSRPAGQGRFWTVLLCTFHGTRLNEVAQLRIEDVKESEGIAFLDIIEGEGQSLKTSASRRRIPIHRKVIELGFMEFVARQRERNGRGMLFPELHGTKKPGDKVTQWWLRNKVDILGFVSSRHGKTLHSLRHSVADAIRRVTTSDEIRYALCGWSKGMRKNSGWDYGDGYPLSKLKEVIDQVEFDGLDLSPLSSKSALVQ